ncbi:hypothetical protein INT46_005029 [Mucor plumbeus]|uniref:Uncharacterized protein n=1 Tax=Mucor plumbeus TaxID=97098 RepID=A0A8H7QFJ6_9FUNG|nr:hypothetical protein INT46_005029 [Mucor plumbeus]
MSIEDEYVPSLWLYELNGELRYYKHSGDDHPASIIELTSFHDIEEHNASVFFGSTLVSETKGQYAPIMYGETRDEYIYG